MKSFIVRFECDNCSSHRDIDLGPINYLKGLVLIASNRIRSVGWYVGVLNSKEVDFCERCNKDIKTNENNLKEN